MQKRQKKMQKETKKSKNIFHENWTKITQFYFKTQVDIGTQLWAFY